MTLRITRPAPCPSCGGESYAEQQVPEVYGCTACGWRIRPSPLGVTVEVPPLTEAQRRAFLILQGGESIMVRGAVSRRRFAARTVLALTERGVARPSLARHGRWVYVKPSDRKAAR